jgi:uncharacterized protein
MASPQRTRYEETLLHIAAHLGYLDVCKLLIDEGIDVNTRDERKQTPLHCAKDLTISRLLLDNGADIDARCDKGRTPLIHAARCREAAICRYLIERGADYDACDCKGKTALCYVKYNGIGDCFDKAVAQHAIHAAIAEREEVGHVAQS